METSKERLIEMSLTLPILLETSDLIVINKPSGLSVHNENNTQSSVLELMGPHLHLAHRLDKETSGILMLSKKKSEAGQLMDSLSLPSSEKYYQAILRGQMSENNSGKTSSHQSTNPISKNATNTSINISKNSLTNNSEQSLLWNWPISDKAEGRRNPKGKSEDRVEARTEIQIIKSNKYFSRIRALLLTGRQHQIRKHAALANHPIVGDTRYNEIKYNQKIFAQYQFERMLLHAEYLKFEFKGNVFEVIAPTDSVFTEIFNPMV